MKCLILKIFLLLGGNRRNNRIIFMSSLCNVLVERGSIVQGIIQLCVYVEQERFL